MMKKLYTESQLRFLFTRKIKVNGSYLVPQFGFHVYPKPKNYPNEWIDSNPMTKSLSNTFFIVSEIKDGFARGRIDADKKKQSVLWLKISELEKRYFIEVIILFLLCSIPFFLFNIWVYFFAPNTQKTPSINTMKKLKELFKQKDKQMHFWAGAIIALLTILFFSVKSEIEPFHISLIGFVVSHAAGILKERFDEISKRGHASDDDILATKLGGLLVSIAYLILILVL